MIRRPFLGIFLCLLIGVLIADYSPVFGAVTVLFFLTALIIYVRKVKNKESSMVLLILLIVMCGIGIRSLHKESFEIPEERMGEIVTFTGELYGIDHINNENYTFKANQVKIRETVQNVDETYRIVISKPSNKNFNGQRVSITTRQEKLKGVTNPGDFNYPGYLNSQGYHGIFFINSKNVRLMNYKYQNFRYLIENIRQNIYEALIETLPEEDAHMLFGIILGDTSFLNKDIKEGFLNTGIAHILAMSGLHFGIIYLLILRMKKMMKLHGDEWRYFAIFLLWLIAFLNGLKPSAFRAVVMLSMMLIAPVFGRRYDTLNIMGMIGCASILYRSDVLYQAGFQLSYMAILAIVFIVPWLKRNNPWKDSDLVDTGIIVIAVQIGMWPVLAYHYNYHSLVGYVLNIPAVYLTGILVPVAILHLMAVFVLKPIVLLTAPLLRLLVLMLVECSRFMSGTSYQGFYMKTPEFSMVVLYIVFVFGIVWHEHLKRFFVKDRERWKSLMIVIPISLCLMFTSYSNSLEILFLDVGQGDAALIKHRLARALIDTGEEKERVYQKLLKNNTDRLEYLIISHSHSDHSGGAVELMQKLDVKNLVLGAFYKNDPMVQKMITVANQEGVSVIWMNQGDVLSLPDGLSLECLYPKLKTFESEEYINDYSIVIELKYKEFECLFTGDIENMGEKSLVNSIVKEDIDILKVPHHGSDTSSSIELLEAFTPEIGIIQVGTNRYGHPNHAIIEQYDRLGMDVYRTDHHGAIRVLTDGESIRISSYLTE